MLWHTHTPNTHKHTNTHPTHTHTPHIHIHTLHTHTHTKHTHHSYTYTHTIFSLLPRTEYGTRKYVTLFTAYVFVPIRTVATAYKVRHNYCGNFFGCCHYCLRFNTSMCQILFPPCSVIPFLIAELATVLSTEWSSERPFLNVEILFVKICPGKFRVIRVSKSYVPFSRKICFGTPNIPCFSRS